MRFPHYLQHAVAGNIGTGGALIRIDVISVLAGVDHSGLANVHSVAGEDRVICDVYSLVAESDVDNFHGYDRDTTF